jgi:hypothetical protein
MEIADALNALRPGAQWALNGNDVSGLTWLDTEQTRPTDAEILTMAIPHPLLSWLTGRAFGSGDGRTLIIWL